ncbi:primary-amine oxidase [Capillimicrobium parvum]|uniref:Amine oxidase n=1 Tax=Capillimicrobium parvum TaxID=2884022 RepID=A0A9E6XXN1_9ACTN|nr:primary-amine oxidase [Capillimicrobium parvum]UGS35993.1 Copper methylamine oxidase [Capillimicrobium parvum]
MDTASPSAALGRRHPLDPLTAEEISRAAATLRAHPECPDGVRFVSISTAEPPRDAADPVRAAQAVLHDVERRTTIEARVDLEADTATDWRVLEGVEPQMTEAEFLAIEAAVRRAPRFQAALKRRGIDDVSLVDVDPVSAGWYDLPEEQGGHRLARILAYVRPEPGGNAYARPLEGIFGLVDIHTGELVHFEDREPVALPAEVGEFRADRIALRDDLRPIHISQPEGPSFTVDGHEVRWQKWRVRVGFDQREGLVLHDLGYEDDGELRPILRRASYAEMVVPYADPDRFYQTPLDIGEFNAGTMTNSLTLGCDCLGVIHYFDGAWANADGEPVVVPNAICLHEEDYGTLWKHMDFRTGHVEVRRARRLVISSFITVGNYDYGFFWYLYQDGIIGSEVKATGIVATQAMADGETSPYGKLVAPNLNAMHHQHVFCARLDPHLDGGGNSVVEVQTEADPVGPGNPHGNAWRTVARTLRTEAEARRRIDLSTARSWYIQNPTRPNRVGQPIAYKLITGENTLPFAAADSSMLRRAGFVDYHLWVTPYDPAERYPAGDYPYQHKGGDGLPRWVQADRSVEDTDIVVWYTMNHHHVPRPEDWPVMPVARIGFELKPWGFFDRSPALDVPPSRPGEGSCHAHREAAD